MPELLTGQINLVPVVQPVPPVVAPLFTVEMNLGDHEVAAEDVVDDQRSEVAVPESRVIGPPARPGDVVGGTGIGSPGGTQGGGDIAQGPDRHARIVAKPTDSLPKINKA